MAAADVKALGDRFQMKLRETTSAIKIIRHEANRVQVEVWERLSRYVAKYNHPSRKLDWLKVLEQTFGHRTFVLEATRFGETVGLLPLAEVRSFLFGKFLVSLPYLNQGGLVVDDLLVAEKLMDEAIWLSDAMDVRYLELRHEHQITHPKMSQQRTSKVHMRLALPSTSEELWSQFKSKLRSQVRNGERNGFLVNWGGAELVDDFYRVFSRNMRDLGTPVYSKKLFRKILEHFPSDAELCCVRTQAEPVAAALLVHGRGVSEVLSASSLRSFSSKNPNMVMYWHLLQRAIARGSQVFDFGRSTINENTFRFKKQWGAVPSAAVWQYYVRKGRCDAVRPENGRFSLAIRTWK
ncbi:MAG: FemAB family XrtA/PEP-CTERM system-associated protein, partial [Pirellula staleyi]